MFKQKSTNIIHNIQECANIFAQNKITIQGQYTVPVTIEQSIDIIQILESNVKIIDDSIEKTKQELENASKRTLKYDNGDNDVHDDSLPERPDADDSSDDEGSSKWVIIVCCVIGVLVIAGVVLFLYMRSKNSVNTDPTITTTPSDQTTIETIY